MKNVFRNGAGLLLANLCALAVHSQFRPLSIKDTMPDFELLGVINKDASNFRISDFKGKLLLIDFWATWCSPCVAALTKLDSFQHAYGNSIQIVSVSTEDSAIVNKLFAKRGRPYSPVVLANDTVFYQLFPHTFLPHLVWINQDGVVIAITEGGDLTATNIETALKKRAFSFTPKKDGNRIVEWPPMFVSGCRVNQAGEQSVDIVDDRNLPFTSRIYKGYMEDMVAMFSFGDDSTRLTYANTCVRNLFHAAFSNGDWGFLACFRRAIVEAKDTSRIITSLIGNACRQWFREGNAYSYELRVPPSLSNRRYQIMQEELNRYFAATLGIEAHLEKRKIPVLILERTSNQLPIQSADDSSQIDNNAYYFSGKSIKTEQLLNVFRFFFQNLNLPLIDETNFKGRFNLEINCPLADLYRVNGELEKAGLQFVRSERKMDVVVIKDIPTKKM